MASGRTRCASVERGSRLRSSLIAELTGASRIGRLSENSSEAETVAARAVWNGGGHGDKRRLLPKWVGSWGQA